jgi:hypothetical protein
MKRLAAVLTILGALAVGALTLGGIAWGDHPIELGTTPQRPAVSCPLNCQAIGQVTGFAVQQGSAYKNPFFRKGSGKVVAFSVTLGRPKDSDIKFFNKLFGNTPQAQITVLRPVPTRRDKQRYQVSAISPPFNLLQYFGSTPTFALPRPLTVKPGYVVALTIPTWAPAFAVNLTNDEIWRSSRDPKQCSNVQQHAAQTVVGQTASYQCMYKTARLLYTVTFIPDPYVSNPPKKPKKRRPRR